MKGKRKFLAILFCSVLCIGMMPLETFAADRTPVLTVDGVDALTTPSGEGWSYDSEENILTLDGYNGGSITATYMDLNVVLAKGSTNVISTSDEFGIAYYQPSYTSPYYTLHIKGAEGSTLDVTARDHAIFSKGDVSIENCNLTAENTTLSTASGEMECIGSENDINITDSVVTVNTNGAGISCYDYNTITGSKVTVTSGMIGIHSNNKNLIINDCQLNVTGGLAALHSMFGTAHLTNCSGELSGGTAAIYAQNENNDGDTELIGCNQLEMKGAYGILTYSGVLIKNGFLTFDTSSMGIYSYSETYDVEAQITGNAKVVCSEQTPQLMQVNGSYISDDTADVTGVILENTGEDATTRILLVGDLLISEDTRYTISTLIPKGANVTVADGASFDLSTAPSIIIEGTLTNHGTLTINGADTTNKGTFYNYGQVVLEDGEDIVNSEMIYSVCTSDFDLSPYGEQGVTFHENLIYNAEKPATHLASGNNAYWYCSQCDRYYQDEQGTEQISYDDIFIPALTEHSADGMGWHSDKESHWHVCECGQILDKAGHTFKWVTDREATKTEAGSGHEECTICGYAKDAVKIPVAETSAENSQTEQNGGTGAKVPETGDSSSAGFWYCITILAGAALIETMIFRRRKSK